MKDSKRRNNKKRQAAAQPSSSSNNDNCDNNNNKKHPRRHCNDKKSLNFATKGGNHSTTSPVKVCLVNYKGISSHSDISNLSSTATDLASLLDRTDMTSSTFLEEYFRKQAVHITCGDHSQRDRKQHKERVHQLRQEMFDLNIESILRETSSENIFLWLRTNQNSPQKDKNNDSQSEQDRIRSIEISDVDTAIALHKTAGHATYCRAPPHVEQPLVANLLRSTGLGCGQYDPSGESVTSLGRGEVETFVSTPGHVTNWHYDFQENFTIQLSGVKRWTLQQGTIQDPVRGCTPHYQAPDAVESQLKAAHLMDRKFRFGHPQAGINAIGDVQSIVVQTGDVLYFPAGMWHKVETIEPGASINVSLMATNYATVVSQAIHHYLMQLPDSKWRQPVINNSSTNVMQEMTGLLQSLPQQLQREHGLISRHSAEFIIPPILQYAPNFSSEQSKEEGQGEEDEDSNSENDSDDEESSAKEVLDPRTFNLYPPGWTSGFKVGGTDRILRNPLAVLHEQTEFTSFYGPRKLNDCDSDNCFVYVLNINYAGNEMHQSAIRVVFRVDESYRGLLETYRNNFEVSDPDDCSTFNMNCAVQSDFKPLMDFLIYHGYIILRK